MIIDQGRVQNGGKMIIRLLLITLYRLVLGLYEEDELITQVASRILHLEHSKALFREALQPDLHEILSRFLNRSSHFFPIHQKTRSVSQIKSADNHGTLLLIDSREELCASLLVQNSSGPKRWRR